MINKTKPRKVVSVVKLVKLVEVVESKHCTCHEGNYEAHNCPFACEIYDDYDTECTCCPYCEEQCFMDI